MRVHFLLAPIAGVLLASSGEMLVGASAARANVVYYAPPVDGNGMVTTLDGDGPYIKKVDIQIPGGVIIKDTLFSEDESYHFNLGGVSGSGTFRISYTMWLTNDGNKIPGTEKQWMSPLVGSSDLPWAQDSLDDDIGYELTDGTLNFNDIHGEFFITSTQPSVLKWNKITLGVDADVAQAVPGPLPILGVASAFSYSRKLRKRIQASRVLRVTKAID